MSLADRIHANNEAELAACVCAPDCPELCCPRRFCANPDCPCYRMWSVEADAFIDAHANLTPEQVHQLLLDTIREAENE